MPLVLPVRLISFLLRENLCTRFLTLRQKQFNPKAKYFYEITTTRKGKPIPKNLQRLHMTSNIASERSTILQLYLTFIWNICSAHNIIVSCFIYFFWYDSFFTINFEFVILRLNLGFCNKHGLLYLNPKLCVKLGILGFKLEF